MLDENNQPIKENVMTLVSDTQNPPPKTPAFATTQPTSHLKDTIDGVSVLKCVGTRSAVCGSQFRQVLDGDGKPVLNDSGKPKYEAVPPTNL